MEEFQHFPVRLPSDIPSVEIRDVQESSKRPLSPSPGTELFVAFQKLQKSGEAVCGVGDAKSTGGF